MGRRATKLDPSTATTVGERQLRELVTRSTYGSIARRLRADESTIRHYARGRRRPDHEMRERLRDAYGIPTDAWDDPYVTEPATTKRET